MRETGLVGPIFDLMKKVVDLVEETPCLTATEVATSERISAGPTTWTLVDLVEETPCLTAADVSLEDETVPRNATELARSDSTVRTPRRVATEVVPMGSLSTFEPWKEATVFFSAIEVVRVAWTGPRNATVVA